MINEYKENILKYITNNLEQQVGTNTPQFQDIDSTTNNLYQQIKAHFDSTVVYVDFVPSRNNKNEGLNYSVLACIGTLTGESSQSGAFVILDKDYTIVDFITEYSDGTSIGVLSALNVDEQGNFYAIEKRNNSFYIVDLNNLVLKRENQANYEVVKKRSIQLPTQYTWQNVFKVYRDTSGEKYFVLADRDFSGDTKTVGISLEITDQNTWTYYNTNYELSNALSIFNNGVNVYWNASGELQFKIAFNDYGLIMYERIGTTTTTTRYTSDETYNNPYCNFIFYSNVIGYYAVMEDDSPNTTFKLYRIDFQNKTTSVIHTDTSSYSINNQMWLYKNNNGIYFTKAKYNGTSYDLSFGLVDNINVYTQNLGSFTASYFLEAFCYSNIITNFNKNYVYIQNQNQLFTLNFLWNTNDYNGSSFISNKSLIPGKFSIEDDNGVEIFNKNLYNLSKYLNRYTATGQVPNYSLNGEIIYKPILISQNNNQMSNKIVNTTKNIYEQLNINFNNKISILDNDNNIENINGATYLVNSMLALNDSAYIGKYKINYHDNTNEIKNIEIPTISDNSTTYKIVVFINKLIDSIDLISNDENTTYKTINCSELELNKYYKITQKLKIE